MTQNTTWDLTVMYQDAAHWREDLEAAKALAADLVAMQGQITDSAEHLLQALQLNDAMGEKISALFVYAKMLFDQNMADKASKDIYETADSAYTLIAEQLAFFEPELLQLTPEIFAQYQEQVPGLQLYAFLMSNLFEQKAHIFDQQIEGDLE